MDCVVRIAGPEVACCAHPGEGAEEDAGCAGGGDAGVGVVRACVCTICSMYSGGEGEGGRGGFTGSPPPWGNIKQKGHLDHTISLVLTKHNIHSHCSYREQRECGLQIKPHTAGVL